MAKLEKILSKLELEGDDDLQELTETENWEVEGGGLVNSGCPANSGCMYQTACPGV